MYIIHMIYIHTLHYIYDYDYNYISLHYHTLACIHYIHYIYTYVRTYARTHAHTEIHTYIHACMHACIHTHTYYTFSPCTQYIQVDRVKESTTLGEGQKKSNVLRALQAFQTYDATGDGSLNIEELRKALKAPGSSLSCWGSLDTPKIVWLVVNK